MENFSWRIFSGVLLIWICLLVAVATSCTYVDISGGLVQLLESPLHLNASFLIPGIIILIFCIWSPAASLFLQNETNETNINWTPRRAIAGAILYALFLISLTGGIKSSAFVSAIPIIMLLASHILRENKIFLATVAIIGIIVISFICNIFEWMKIPSKYPSGWEHAGTGVEYTILSLVIMGFFLDALFEQKLLHKSGYSMVSVGGKQG